MRVAESKTNDYCTHETHEHTHCIMTAAVWLNEQCAASWSICQPLCCSPLLLPSILKTWIDAWNDSGHYLCNVEHLFQCMHSSQERRRINNIARSLSMVNHTVKESLAGEGYLSSRAPFSRGHSDSWAGCTWNALMWLSLAQLLSAACSLQKVAYVQVCSCLCQALGCQSSRQRGGVVGATDRPFVSQPSLSVLRGSSCPLRSGSPITRHHLLIV